MFNLVEDFFKNNERKRVEDLFEDNEEESHNIDEENEINSKKIENCLTYLLAKARKKTNAREKYYSSKIEKQK